MHKLTTGEHYTLSQLFSGSRRIIIPDLQRDYCWGGQQGEEGAIFGDLVTGFVKGLMQLYDKGSTTNHLGLFYGYELPMNHVQLCDAQQRITTLYLLLGMLHRQVGGLCEHLLSDDDEMGDKTPRLQYAIRESSLYFLRDLVGELFVKGEGTLENLRHSDWYFGEYDLDPSVQSMLLALKTIERLLEGKEEDRQRGFSRWLLHDLHLLYVDMENRQNGEETFVVINTTGEPLSPTENLKPLVLTTPINQGQEGLGEQWEEVETWFWKQRQGANDTADVGFAEFLRWVSVMAHSVGIDDLPKNEDVAKAVLQGSAKYKYPCEQVSFATIYRYWQSLKKLQDLGKALAGDDFLSPAKGSISQIHCFRLLPLLHFVYRHPEATARERLRVGRWLENIVRIERVRKDINDLVPHAISLVDQMKGADILSLMEIAQGGDPLLSEEERRKLEILRSAEQREAVEERFWKVQARPLWKGEILPVLRWATREAAFSFERFEQYADLLDALLPQKKQHDALTLTLRRCMIVCSDQYRPVQRGRYHSFGWEWSDWRVFFKRKSAQGFVDELLDRGTLAHKEEMKRILEQYIADHWRAEKPYSEFAQDDFLLSFTRGAQACDIVWEGGDRQLAVKGSTVRHHAFLSLSNARLLREFGYDSQRGGKQQLENGWLLWYWASTADGNCVVFEHAGIKLDTRWISTDKENDLATITLRVKTCDNKTNLSLLHPRLLEVFGRTSDCKEEVVERYSCQPAAIKPTLEELMQKIGAALVPDER